MSWPTARLESLAADERYSFVGGPFGSKLTSKDYVEEGVPVIRGSNLNNGRYLGMNDFVFVSEDKVRKDLFGNLAAPKDLVFTQRGTLGQVAIIPEDGICDHYVISQSQMKMTVDTNKANALFLYYYFSSASTVQSIMNLVSSSGVPHINLTILREFEVPTPPVAVQREIASILSAYDDLIENNRRRIQLLEESARLLYKEWFVHLRFPGHERVKIKNGVPEGWEKKKLGEILTLQRGFDLPTQERQEGEVPVYGSTGINGYHNKAHVVGPGVVTGRSGSLGTVMYVPTDYWPLNTSLWVKEFFGIGPLFAHQLLSHLPLAQFNGGVAVPTLNRNDVHQIEVLAPEKNVLSEFEAIAKPIYDQLFQLEKLNSATTRARDLLLPKLMNGEVVV